MSSLFARVVKQAFITFDQGNVAKFKTNFGALKLLVDQLTPKDLNIDPDLMNSNTFNSRPDKAPVTYMEIFQHDNFTMSVFIVANKYTMPLHDHPGFGLLRVLSGTARIQSYTLLKSGGAEHPSPPDQPKILTVIEEPIRDVTLKSECAILTPTKCNIHEITAIKHEPAAFFDILSPPYESEISIYGPKKCSFYKRIYASGDVDMPSSSCDTDGDEADIARPNVHLQFINSPSHYYCDTARYFPPDFLRDCQ